MWGFPGDDRNWVALKEIVRAALDDAEVLSAPPTTSEELDDLADTIADHLAPAIELSRIQKKDAWSRRKDPRK
jgi:hypothetical protein